MKINKEKMKDKMGRALTQGLFLEYQYDETFAIFTLEDQDKEYNGNHYISLKRLYLECEDVVEYDFATTYLLGWGHWKKLQGNAFLMKHITEWREELELKLSSQAFQKILDNAEENYQAAKYLANKEWKKNAVGRPQKSKVDEAVDRRLEEDFQADILRMGNYK